jgi:hypothetical protein
MLEIVDNVRDAEASFKRQIPRRRYFRSATPHGNALSF